MHLLRPILAIAPALALLLLPAVLLSQAQPQPQPRTQPQPQPQPPLRVRCSGCAAPLDSVWVGERWDWTGPCDGATVEFRFDREDGTFAVQTWSCVVNDVALSEAVDAAPQVSSKASPAIAVVPRGWSREEVAGWSWQERKAGGCYPPVSRAALATIVQEVHDLPFERDRVARLAAWSKERCLSGTAAVALLTTVQDEARRLELLQALVSAVDVPSGLPISTLFHLEMYRKQAAEVVKNVAPCAGC